MLAVQCVFVPNKETSMSSYHNIEDIPDEETLMSSYHNKEDIPNEGTPISSYHNNEDISDEETPMSLTITTKIFQMKKRLCLLP